MRAASFLRAHVRPGDPAGLSWPSRRSALAAHCIMSAWPAAKVLREVAMKCVVSAMGFSQSPVDIELKFIICSNVGIVKAAVRFA